MVKNFNGDDAMNSIMSKYASMNSSGVNMSMNTNTNMSPNFHFSIGALTTLSETITNAYTGETFFLEGLYNVNSGIYMGDPDVDDFLFFSDTVNPNYLSLVNDQGAVVLHNIDVIFGGNGGDVINLSHPTETIEGLTIFGGSGDDLFIGNAGDDTLHGNLGNDILDGGLGNDLLYGQGDDDILKGGDGNDTAYGGDGNDFVYGGAGDDLVYGEMGSDLLSGGEGDDILHYNQDDQWGGGWYAWNVGSPDNPINGALVQLTEPSRGRSHDVFDGGEGYDVIMLTGGHDAIFLDDRYSPNQNGYNTARVIDIEEIWAGEGDDIVDLTSQIHAHGDICVYGEAGQDVLWTSSGDDYLDGGDGNDILDGGTGNDILVGGVGADTLTGSLGSDVFGWLMADLDGAGDAITDFETGVGGDVINIADLLSDYDDMTDAIADFISLVDNGTDTEIYVDIDGQGSGSSTHLVTLDDVTGQSLADLIDNGNLVYDQLFTV